VLPEGFRRRIDQEIVLLERIATRACVCKVVVVAHEFGVGALSEDVFDRETSPATWIPPLAFEAVDASKFELVTEPVLKFLIVCVPARAVLPGRGTRRE